MWKSLRYKLIIPGIVLAAGTFLYFSDFAGIRTHKKMQEENKAMQLGLAQLSKVRIVSLDVDLIGDKFVFEHGPGGLPITDSEFLKLLRWEIDSKDNLTFIEFLYAPSRWPEITSVFLREMRRAGFGGFCLDVNISLSAEQANLLDAFFDFTAREARLRSLFPTLRQTAKLPAPLRKRADYVFPEDVPMDVATHWRKPTADAMPPPLTPAPELTDTERVALREIGGYETGTHHIKVGDILLNRNLMRLEIPAYVNLSSGLIEVILCHPANGRVHESLFVTTAKPFDLQLALYLLNLQNGNLPKGEKASRTSDLGDKVNLSVHVHGYRHVLPLGSWIVYENTDTHPRLNGIYFLGSGFKDKKCLADGEGNLIDVNSMDNNTILYADFVGTEAQRFYCDTLNIPRYMGDKFPIPANEMESRPVRPAIPAELEIPVTILITPEVK